MHLRNSIIAIVAIMVVACSTRQADSTDPDVTFAGTLTDAKHLARTLAMESSKQPFTYAKQ